MRIISKKLEQQWRRQLLAYAKGNVLEPGIGTGTNFKYYPFDVKVTGTDISDRMIQQARIEAIASGIHSDFIIAPVHELEFAAHSFDTIVSTFTLCDYDNPVEVLDKFNTWCKPDGTVLLLEYGLSPNGLVRWFQQKWEPFQYRNSGSHLNRDMIDIISNSKLRLKKVEIKYAGMVYLVWATLGPG